MSIFTPDSTSSDWITKDILERARDCLATQEDTIDKLVDKGVLTQNAAQAMMLRNAFPKLDELEVKTLLHACQKEESPKEKSPDVAQDVAGKVATTM